MLVFHVSLVGVLAVFCYRNVSWCSVSSSLHPGGCRLAIIILLSQPHSGEVGGILQILMAGLHGWI